MDPAEPAAAPLSSAPASAGPGSPAAPASAAPATAAPASTAPATAAPSRAERRPRDMALSLAILIIPIALLLIFYRLVLQGDAPTKVDPTPTIQEAQQANLFPIAVPHLPDSWSVSAATFTRTATGATMRIGYVDPDKDPVQLVESSVAAETLLPAELGSTAKPVNTSFRAANGVWRQYDARPGEQALVLSGTGRTIIVVGRTGIDNLQTLAGSLS